MLRAHENESGFHYQYDFGNGWEHQVVIEEPSRSPAGLKFAEQNACPPEDVGGAGLVTPNSSRALPVLSSTNTKALSRGAVAPSILQSSISPTSTLAVRRFAERKP